MSPEVSTSNKFLLLSERMGPQILTPTEHAKEKSSKQFFGNSKLHHCDTDFPEGKRDIVVLSETMEAYTVREQMPVVTQAGC